MRLNEQCVHGVWEAAVQGSLGSGSSPECGRIAGEELVGLLDTTAVTRTSKSLGAPHFETARWIKNVIFPQGINEIKINILEFRGKYLKSTESVCPLIQPLSL